MMLVKRWLTVGFITVYLGALSYGNFCHMLGHGLAAHPFMYQIVWDMFCGWSAYDTRLYVVAEGEDGSYYELAPGPWGDFVPWGFLGRQHYDPTNAYTARFAMNALAHSRHEPISRIFVIEECWAKKYNLPDVVWRTRYDEPREPKKYYRLRTVMLPCGTIVANHTAWVANQAQAMLSDNPRLKRQASLSRSMFVLDGQKPGREMIIHPNAGSGSPFEPPSNNGVGAPLGN